MKFNLVAPHFSSSKKMPYGNDAGSMSINGGQTRLLLRSGIELCNLPPMQWLIKGILSRFGLAALYGPSGSGKSFLALDLAASVASGLPLWFEHRVHCAHVTYVCLEGEQGMGKRLQAWTAHHQRPIPDSLRFVTQSFNLLSELDIDDLAFAVNTSGGPGGLVILDTLNRSAPGADENTSADMGRIISGAKRLQEQIGGLVLLVHHTGKDIARGLRGHSSLYAALDGAIEVTRTKTAREWCVTKSKDDESGRTYGFDLRVIKLGHDPDGDEITSCVAIPRNEAQLVKQARTPSGTNQKVAYQTIESLLDGDASEVRKTGPRVQLGTAIDTIAASLECSKKHRRVRAQEAVEALLEQQYYVTDGQWLCRPISRSSPVFPAS